MRGEGEGGVELWKEMLFNMTIEEKFSSVAIKFNLVVAKWPCLFSNSFHSAAAGNNNKNQK